MDYNRGRAPVRPDVSRAGVESLEPAFLFSERRGRYAIFSCQALFPARPCLLISLVSRSEKCYNVLVQ